MMRDGTNKRMMRPRTAATTTKKDEDRIKKKIAMLENIERKIDEDIEEFNSKRKTTSNHFEKGVRITKKMLLEVS